MLHKAVVGLWRQFEFPEHLKLSLGSAEVCSLIFRLLRGTRDELVGNKGLELHRIGTRVGCAVDKSNSQIRIAIVVDARFGDDKDGITHASLHFTRRVAHIDTGFSDIANHHCARTDNSF